MNRFKGFLARAGTKGKIAVSSVVSLGTAAFPGVTAFAEGGAAGTGGDISPPALTGGGGGIMWETIGDGASMFVTKVLTPVGTFCTSNEICLAFLSVTFVGLGIRMLRRAIGAFGRGR